MANRFLTRDEEILDIACPALKAMIRIAAAKKRAHPEDSRITVANAAGGDLMPVAFDMTSEPDVNEWERKMLASVEGVETAARARSEFFRTRPDLE